MNAVNVFITWDNQTGQTVKINSRVMSPNPVTIGPDEQAKAEFGAESEMPVPFLGQMPPLNFSLNFIKVDGGWKIVEDTGRTSIDLGVLPGTNELIFTATLILFQNRETGVHVIISEISN